MLKFSLRKLPVTLCKELVAAAEFVFLDLGCKAKTFAIEFNNKIT